MMSLSGLRKQLNKANQFLSETMGSAEATKLDDQFNGMERKVDVTNESVTSLVAAVHEYLQPNPATRAKMATMGALSKVRGTAKTSPYPQTEGLLADTMQKYGIALGPDSDFGRALIDASEAYHQMADIKYQMEDNVNHNFLDPLMRLQQTDLKEVNHHRTKLRGRRLDYDCKKRKQTGDDELIQAEAKLEESKQLAEQAMHNLLSNDIEQVTQLYALVDAQLTFHQQTAQVLERLKAQISDRVEETKGRPKTEHVVKPVLNERTMTKSGQSSISPSNPTFISSTNYAAPSTSSKSTSEGNWAPGLVDIVQTPSAPPARQAKVKAIYDFQAMEPGELNFKEGNLIDLIAKVDENWFEGTLDGKTGVFPISYVQVLVPL